MGERWELVNRIWKVGSFLAIVLQLIIIRGFSAGIIYVFVAPVLVAFLISMNGQTQRGRTIAKWFVTLAGLGLFSTWPRICPDLGGVDDALTPQQDAALAWYGIVYIGFLLVVAPVHLFLVSLQAHREGKPAQFSRFTCRLGLGAILLVGPFLVYTMMDAMHFFPIYR